MSQFRKITVLYWSATGNTKKVVCAIGYKLGEYFGCPVEEYDFTPSSAREHVKTFDENDLVIVGSPTYAGKLPNKILPDFQGKLSGKGTVAAAVVTYGNRAYDNSLAELAEVLLQNGFCPAGAAAFPCRHAFTDRLACGRPDKEDLKQAEEFAVCLAEKLSSAAPDMKPEDIRAPRVPGDAAAPYYVPRGTDGEPAKFLKAKPKTDAAKCNRCGDCVRLCPMDSIDPENPLNVPGICIKCQACVRGCPQKAKYFDDPAFLSHVAMLEQSFTDKKETEFYL